MPDDPDAESAAEELRDDPDAKKLKPPVSKRAMIYAVIAGMLFGLGLAIAGYIFEQRIPRFGSRALPDAGPAELPTVDELDAGTSSEQSASPWLE